jgi:glutaredoxin
MRLRRWKCPYCKAMFWPMVWAGVEYGPVTTFWKYTCVHCGTTVKREKRRMKPHV